MTKIKKVSIFGRIFNSLVVVVSAALITVGLFLLLPILQTISKPPTADLVVRNVDVANVPPPPAPPEQEQEQEPEEQETPPQLSDEAPPVSLSQLELALNPGFGGGGLGGDFAVKLNTSINVGGGVDELFSIADLDQKPRAIYQPSPRVSKDIQKKAPGTVYVIFVVGQDGRVQSPIVQKSTDPIFDKPALDAVKKWKFEPGKRNGNAVRFRMRVPITFPRG